MSRSAEDLALDEKIARIRQQNKKIIKRDQLIRMEIELAKKHNAMVNIKAPKISEDDSKPTLYADTIENLPKTGFNAHKKVSFESRNYPNDDSVWRAERNQIDEERIRRQRDNFGWKREWDANKTTSNNELPSSLDKLDTNNEHQKRSTRSSQPHLVANQQIELQAKRPSQSRGRGRGLIRPQPHSEKPIFRHRNIDGQNTKDLRNLLSSYDSKETELINTPKISLRDNHLKNIKIKLNRVESAAGKRCVEMSEDRGPLDKLANISKFDETTSLNIKDCVAKTSSNPSQVQQFVTRELITLPKPKNVDAKETAKSFVKTVTKPSTVESKTTSKNVTFTAAKSKPASKEDKSSISPNTDSEWEDVSDEEWESVSNEE